MTGSRSLTWPNSVFCSEEYYRSHPELRGRETVHWFLDEIQLVPGWERFVRRVLDSEQVEIVVSGSSARMLSREVHTSLRGRGIATVIRPFSFREFLRHRGEEPATPASRWTSADRSLVERRFREYLSQGGVPEVQGLPPTLGIELLQGYVDTVLFRDVVERYGVSQVIALRWLVRHCLRNPAGRVSVHRMHQDLKSQGHRSPGHRIGTPPQLQPAQALSGGPRPHPGLRRQWPDEPRACVGNRRAERTGAAQCRGELREDRARI